MSGPSSERAVAAPTAPDAAEVRIAPLAACDAEAAAQLLARAFRDNPLNVAVMHGRNAEARLRGNLWGMRALLPSALSHGNVRVANQAGDPGRPLGVLIAAPPCAYPLPPAPLGRRLRSLLGQGLGSARRWRRVFETLDAVHPVEPHWYLGTLGVAPERQRQGVGRALLDAWLAGVDAEGRRAYLETDRSENVAFYAAAGFGVLREIDVIGVPVWLMARPRQRPGQTAGDA